MLGGVALVRKTERERRKQKSEDLSSGEKEEKSIFLNRSRSFRLLSSDSKSDGEIFDFRRPRETRSEKTLRVAPCFVSASINRGHVDRFEEGNFDGVDGTTKGHTIEGRSIGSRSTRGGACK